MIRSLRRRFILGAMLAFSILLLLLDGGIVIGGYVRMESRADDFLNRMLSEEGHVWPAERPEESGKERREQPVFGYNLPDQNYPAGHYVILADEQGELLNVAERGILEPDADALQADVAQIIAAGRERGKIGEYKYAMRTEAYGMYRIVLMDNSIQVHMLAEILRMACLASLACLAGMYLILLPVSRRMVHSYAQNIEKQKQFITNAGHEIKTPVAIILSNVDAMELIQGENKWSRNIRGQVDRLCVLLKQLLDMARIDERSMNLSAQWLDLSALLREESDAYAELFTERRLEFRREIRDGVAICADRESMCRLTHILLDNAAQYANQGGWIELRLEKRRHHVQIAMRNSVETLPDCAPGRLFERFFRGDSARTQKDAGCGVGLSAAQTIVELHRGKIEADYEGENILRFTVELPHGLRG